MRPVRKNSSSPGTLPSGARTKPRWAAATGPRPATCPNFCASSTWPAISAGRLRGASDADLPAREASGYGAPGWIRTADAGLRTAALYPLSYGGAGSIVPRRRRRSARRRASADAHHVDPDHPVVVGHVGLVVDHVAVRVAHGAGHHDVLAVHGPLGPIALAAPQRRGPDGGVVALDHVRDLRPAQRHGPAVRDGPDLEPDDAGRREAADEDRVLGVVREPHGL